MLGSVGIGTTANVNYTLNIASGAVLLNNNSTLGIGTTTSGYTNALNVYGNSSVYGCIGIGVAASTNPLTVAAGICNFANGTSINVGSSGTTNSLNVYGSIGIGTIAVTASSALISVNAGTINFYNGTTFNIGTSATTTTSTLNLYGSSYITGNLGIGTNASSIAGNYLTIAAGNTTFISASTVNIGSLNTVTSTLNVNGVLNVVSNATISGNIGIGTSVSATANDFISVGGSGTIRFGTKTTMILGTSGGTASTFTLYGNNSVSGTSDLIGNVGIGTTSSTTYLLNVSPGNTFFGDGSIVRIGLITASTNALNIYGNSTIYNNVGIGIAADTTGTNRLVVASGSVTLKNTATLNVGDAVSQTNNYLNVYGTVGIGTVADTTAANKFTMASGTANFINPSTVNIGVSGTTNSTLNIYGTSYISTTLGIGTTTYLSSLVTIATIAGANSLTLMDPAILSVGTTGKTSSLLLFGNCTIEGTTYIKGNVGIGTAPDTTSGNILTINGGTINLKSTTTFNIGTSGDTTNKLYVYGDNSVSGKSTLNSYVGIGTAPSTSYILNVYGATYFQASTTSTSCVGINTVPNATYPLIVNGKSSFTDTVNISSIILEPSNNSITATTLSGTLAVSNLSGVIPIGNGGLGTSTFTTNALLYYDNANTKIASVTNFTYDSTTGIKLTTGNLGIGTTTLLKNDGTITAVSFTGSGANITDIALTTNTTGTLSVAQGGSGANTFTVNRLLVGNGTAAITTTGDGLSWDGTNLTSTTAIFTAKSFVGIGSSLTQLNAANITTGTMPISSGGTGTTTFTSGTILYYNGTNIKSLDNIAWTATAPVNTLAITGSLTVSTAINLSTTITLTASTGNITATTFSGNGASLTNISPANFSSTVPISLGGTNNTAFATNNSIIYYNGTKLDVIGAAVTWASSLLSITGGITATATVTANNVVSSTAIAISSGGIGTNTLTTNAILLGGTTVNTVSGLTWASSTLSVPGGISVTAGTITVTTPIGVASGGTGISAVTAGQILFGSTASVLDSSTNFKWNTTTNKLTIVGDIAASTLALTTPLPIASGGTGASSFTVNKILGVGSVATSLVTTSIGWDGTTLSIPGAASLTTSLTVAASLTAASATLSSPLTVACGGTGVATFTAGNILVGGTTLGGSTNLTWSSISSVNTLTVTGACTVSGRITAGTFAGNGAAITNISGGNIVGAASINTNCLKFDTNFAVDTNGLLTYKGASSAWLVSGTSIVCNTYSVGINTSVIASNYKLDVQGGPLNVCNTTTLCDMGTATTKYFSLSNTNAKLGDGTTFSTTMNGNVGINTAPSTTYQLYVGGNIAATLNIGITSDERLKENIKNIDNALEKILKCRGVYFNRKNTINKRISIGVIAQEIEKILPEVVLEDNDGYKVVLYQNIIGVLIEAIKDIDKKYNSLENRIINLEKKYT